MKEFPFRKVTGIGRNSATRKIGKNKFQILMLTIFLYSIMVFQELEMVKKIRSEFQSRSEEEDSPVSRCCNL